MTTDMDVSSNGHTGPDAQQRVIDALGNEFSAESLRVLSEAAIPYDRAAEYGIRAVAAPEHVPDEIDRFWVIGDDRGPGMLFEWRDTDRTVMQFRPDTPVRGADGKDHKYIAASGSGTFLNHLREPAADDDPYLFVEGSKQGVAAAVWAPDGWGVVSVPGCNNWVGTDLTWADGRKVIVLFDKDLTTNRGVHDAASGLKEALEVEGADEVVFARLAGARAKDGLDDVLGRRPEARRTTYITNIAARANGSLGRAPARGSSNPYMGDKGLLARTASLAVLEGQPAALAAGSMIALYRNGAFRVDMGREPIIEQVKDLLGEDYRPQWRATIEEFLVGELSGRGLRVGDRAGEPILNCRNAMVDLRTGETKDHDPSYLSTLQIPVMWMPDAACPTYEAWLADVIPDQAEALEEVASTMLDPSRTPLKQAFLFGPTHSGKSTFLRIMMAIAGENNTSAVGLHQMVDDKFMSAELYQKMLNSASEIGSAHIDDVSLFKRLTGEDPIQANRKYGKTFTFTNRALFAFSANEIPTVSETSRAYVQRIAAFGFSRSFAGSEDPRIEETMIRNELPGILARWVRSWRRFNDRGVYLPPDRDVQEEFETKSDRIARWVRARCDVHPDVIGQLVGPDQGSGVSDLYLSFKIWAREDGPANVMSRPKFSERLKTMDGVGDVRLKHKSKNMGLNVTTHTGEDRERVQIGTHTLEKAPESVGSVVFGPTGAMSGTTECAKNVNDLDGVDGVGDESVPDMREIRALPTLPTPPTPVESEKKDHGRGNHDVRPGVPGPASAAPQQESDDQDSNGKPGQETDSGIRTGTGREDRGSDAPARGDTAEHRVPGGHIPEIDPGPGMDGGPAVTTTVVPPDPFAVYEVPPYDGTIGLDLETHGADEMFRHGPGFVRLVAAGTTGHVVTSDFGAVEMIKGGNTIVGANIALFDLPAIERDGGPRVEDTVPRAHDVRFTAFQADPPTSYETSPGPGYKHYSLDALGERYLGRAKSGLGKALAKEFGGWGNIPYTDPRYHAYGRDDVELALALAELLPMTDYDRREMEIAAITARATLEGFRVDVPGLTRRVAELDAQSRKGRAALAGDYGFPLTNQAGKPAKAPQRTKAGKAAFEAAVTAAGIDVGQWPRGKDGTLSMGKEILAEVLEYAQAEGYRDAAVIITAVQEMNGIRTNAANLLKWTVGDRAHAKFEPFQSTGRWSIVDPGYTVFKKGVPDSERAFMLAEEGHVLVAFDADQVDIRCVAAHSQDPGLLAIMQDPDRDIHNEVSDMAFGRHDEPYRHHGKSCDLGWLYGRSVNGLAMTPGITREAAARVDEAMREQFATVPDWQHDVRRAAEGRAILDNGFGRHFRCDEGREYTQAPAGFGQSMTRDVIAEGLLRMKRNHPELIKMLRVIVHDEIVMSIPKDDLEDVCRAVINDMTQEIKGTPFTFGRSRASENWAGCYLKDDQVSSK